MIIIAHRGSSQVAPENTLPAIKKAIQDGADAIEIDVQLTKDKEVVVIHDEWVNRTTNGRGFVCDLTFDELQTLDAGSWLHPRYKGTTIPSLGQVLEWIERYQIPLIIELKNNLIPYPQLEEKTIELIRQWKVEEQVILSSFKRTSLERCQSLAPEIRRACICWYMPSLFHEEWESLKLYSIHLPIALIDERITVLQRKGYKIFPYVIENLHQLQASRFYDVDGIFTNAPKKSKQLLQTLS